MTLKSLKQKLILYFIVSEWALGTAEQSSVFAYVIRLLGLKQMGVL